MIKLKASRLRFSSRRRQMSRHRDRRHVSRDKQSQNHKSPCHRLMCHQSFKGGWRVIPVNSISHKFRSLSSSLKNFNFSKLFKSSLHLFSLPCPIFAQTTFSPTPYIEIPPTKLKVEAHHFLKDLTRLTLPSHQEDPLRKGTPTTISEA